MAFCFIFAQFAYMGCGVFPPVCIDSGIFMFVFIYFISMGGFSLLYWWFRRVDYLELFRFIVFRHGFCFRIWVFPMRRGRLYPMSFSHSLFFSFSGSSSYIHCMYIVVCILQSLLRLPVVQIIRRIPPLLYLMGWRLSFLVLLLVGNWYKTPPNYSLFLKLFWRLFSFVVFTFFVIICFVFCVYLSF